MSLEEAVKKLKRQLHETEQNLSLAAQYGKHLLEENAELNSKLEEKIKEFGIKEEKYEQEIYSKSMTISTRDGTILSLQSELETIESLHSKIMAQVVSENEKKIAELHKQITEKKDMIDSLESEILIYENQVKELENLLMESKLQRETSIISVEPLNESYSLQNQIQNLTDEKQDLEAALTKARSLFKTAVVECDRLKKSSESKNEDLEEKECKITSLYNNIEKNKETVMELQVEIDQLKMATTDPLKKGNSLFAEVEDNRQLLEKKVLSLSTNHSTLLKQIELKNQQVAKMKLQIASLLSLSSSSESDLEYQKGLEESLAAAKCQLEDFSKRCKELESKKTTNDNNVYSVEGSKVEIQNLFQNLYEKTKKNVTRLEEEVNSLKFNKVSLEDQLLQMKRKLYQTEREKDLACSELIKVRVQLEEEAISKGQTSESKARNAKEFKEKLPFEIENHTEEEAPLKDKFIITNGEMKNEKLIQSRKVEDDVSKLKIEDKENVCLKKVKKSVKMAETVTVKEAETSEERTEKLQEKPSKKKLSPVRRPRKVMEAPRAQQMSAEEQNECKQQ